MIVMNLVRGFPHSFACWNASAIALGKFFGKGKGLGSGASKPLLLNVGMLLLMDFASILVFLFL